MSKEEPFSYACGECGARECKLWRQYGSVTCLRCASCLGINPDKKGRVRDATFDSLTYALTGGWIPAVISAELDFMFGFHLMSLDRLAWWQALSTTPMPAAPAVGNQRSASQ